MKMKSTYEKPSEKKKRVQTENIKKIKKSIKREDYERHMEKYNGLTPKKVMGL